MFDIPITSRKGKEREKQGFFKEVSKCLRKLSG